MTEFIIFWILTILTSFSMQLAFVLRVFKDLADLGYKFNLDKFRNKNNLPVDTFEKNNFITLIPFINLISEIKKVNNYNTNRQVILEQFKTLNLLENLSDFEKGEYLKKPTSLNAFLLPIKLEIRLDKSICLTIKEEEGTSKVYFEMGNTFDDLIILKTEGPISNLSKEEQKKKISETAKRMLTKQIDKIFSQALQNMENNSNLVNDKTINDKKHDLEELKDSLTKEYNIYKENDNIYKINLVKRRKK